MENLISLLIKNSNLLNTFNKFAQEEFTVTKIGNAWVATVSYANKDFAKSAGFQWDRVVPRSWATRDDNIIRALDKGVWKIVGNIPDEVNKVNEVSTVNQEKNIGGRYLIRADENDLGIGIYDNGKGMYYISGPSSYNLHQKIDFKKLGMRWNSNQKVWETNDLKIASIFTSINAFNSYTKSLLKEKEESYQQSMATDSNKEFKAPVGKEYRGFQKAGIEFSLGKAASIIADEMGLGKSQPLDAKILTTDGWTTMGNIKVGDYVIGSNGQPTKVLNVYPQGIRPIYKVTMNDGTWTECDEEHLWCVNTTIRIGRDNPFVVKTLKEIKERITTNSGVYLHYIPMTSPVEFIKKDLPIHPYLLGLLLGDGGIKHRVSFSSMDSEIIDSIPPMLPDSISIKKVAGNNCDYNLSSGTPGKSNEIMNMLRNLGLMGKGSYDKFIPDIYKYNSFENRLDVLHGLMDTDGSISKNDKHIEFCSVSIQLAEDIKELVMSFGGTAKIHKKILKKINHVSWRVSINMPRGINAFQLSRKANLCIDRIKYPPIRYIKAVEYIGDKEAQCINVEAEDNLYITDNYIVTHNTIQTIGVINNDPSLKKILIIVPATLKINWARELEDWLTRKDLSVGIAESTSVPNTNIVIINYDILYKNKNIINNIEWDLVVADEAHKFKNPKSKRTLAIIGELNKDIYKREGGIYAKKKILLTGTPIANRPQELWTLLHFLDPKKFSSSIKFADRYMQKKQIFVPKKGNIEKKPKTQEEELTREKENKKFTGGSYRTIYYGGQNLDELNRLLRENYMIRRMKSDVLKELPPKIRSVVEIDVHNPDLQRKQEDILNKTGIKDLEAVLATSKTDEEYLKILEQIQKQMALSFEEISKLRHDTGLAKAPYVGEYTLDLAEDNSDKFIIFAHHHDVINMIKEILETSYPNSTVIVTGNENMKKRQEAVDAFQSNPDVRFFIGNIGAAGVGLNLTKSQNVIFAEMDWVPANMQQAEDRCIVEGQLVHVLNKGMIPIEKVELDDKVLTHQGNWERVIKKTKRQHRYLITEIKYSRFYDNLKSTHDHKILIKSNDESPIWKMAYQTLPGDFVCFPKIKEGTKLEKIDISSYAHDDIFENNYNVKQKNGRLIHLPTQIQIDNNWLYLFGWYIAEGFVGNKDNPRFVSLSGHTKEYNILDDIGKFLQNYHLNYNIYQSKSKQAIEFRIYNIELAKWFKDWFGDNCYEKKIPDILMNLNIEQTNILLRGYLDGDGYRRKKQQECVTVSPILSTQTLYLMNKCGYIPSQRIVYGHTNTLQYISGYTEFNTTHKKLNNMDDNYIYHPVTSVLTQYAKRPTYVYDLTVENDHSFVVGMAVVHNCHRIGQQEDTPVNIHYLTQRNSLDSHIARLVSQKLNIIDKTLNKVVDSKEKALQIEQLPEIPTKSKFKRIENPVTPSAPVAPIPAKYTPEQVQSIYAALLRLTEKNYDFGRERNDVGWNKLHGSFGESLANQINAGRKLSEKQLDAAVKMLTWYRNTQISDLAPIIWSDYINKK